MQEAWILLFFVIVGKLVKRLLAVIGVLIAALVILLAVFALFFDVNRYKPSIEAAVSKNLGMQLKIQGKISLRVFPAVHVVLRDIHLMNGKSELFSADELEVRPRLLPLIAHREISIDQLNLIRPRIRVEKDTQGRMNYETTPKAAPQARAAAGQKAKGGVRPGAVTSVSVRDGEVAYVDRRSGQTADVKGLDLKLSDISWQQGTKSVSLHGSLRAKSLQSGKILVSNLKTSIRDQAGVVELDPMEFSVFGGHAKGIVKADLTKAQPRIHVAQTASNIDLSQVVPASKKVAVSGLTQASVKLDAQGLDQKTLIKTAHGDVSIRNQGVVILHHLDIDKMLATYESAENLNFSQLGTNLAQLGTAFVGGSFEPSGKAAQAGSGGESQIQKLVSDWTIANGVATAKDFAFSTAKNTVAFKGALNLLTRTYQGFYVATVDPRGCAKAKQEIAGTFTHPRPVITSSTVAKTAESAAFGKMNESLGAALGGMLPPGAQPKPPAQQSGQQPGQQHGKPPAAPAACDDFYKGSAIRTG